MKFLEASVLVFLLLQSHVKSQMAEKQFQSSIRLLRNLCQPKTKVTNELIAAMHEGEFVKERTLMCYMECCLKAAKAMKDGKFDYDSVVSLSKTIPLARQEPTVSTANACKDSGGLADKCESGFDIYKCMYDANPSEFFFP